MAKVFEYYDAQGFKVLINIVLLSSIPKIKGPKTRRGTFPNT
jgi:hypothetical protein